MRGFLDYALQQLLMQATLGKLRKRDRLFRRVFLLAMMLMTTAIVKAADGDLDRSYGNDGISIIRVDGRTAYSVGKPILLADGKMLLGGVSNFLPMQNVGSSIILRVNADGTLDATFGTGGTVVFGLESLHDEEFIEVAIQPDGKILALGDSNSSNNSGFLLWRFNPNGTPDTSFGTGGMVRTPFGSNAAFTSTVLIQPDGKILAAGFTPLFQSSDFAVVRYLNTTALRSTPFDFDGDRKADISVFRNGIWHLNRSTTGYLAFQFGLNSDRIVPADFDGDGKTDIAVFRPSEGNWYCFNSGSGTYSISHFGANGDIPVASDYDGDGKSDIAVFRDGTWYIQKSAGGTLITQFGLSGDMPVVCDYDGDGKADIAVWRPSDGVWHYLKSSDGSYYSYQFGSNGDMPTPSDYDGDGKADLAIYRGGQWWIWQSRTNNYSVQQFGNVGDEPVPSAYIQ